MKITPINNYKNIYYTNVSNNRHTNFKSNQEHEAMLRQLELEQKRQEEQKELERRQNLAKQEFKEKYAMKLKKSSNACLAQFALNFACAIQNASDHNLKEFFGTETEAKTLRSKLSPECQKNSIELREKIQKREEFTDPVLSLITANKMKEFVPEENVLTDNQLKDVIDATKKCFISAIENSDKTKFNVTEKTLITKLKNIISSSEGVNFGAEFDTYLKQLIHSCDMNMKNTNTIYNTNTIKNIIKQKI